jgi:cell division protein FtsB
MPLPRRRFRLSTLLWLTLAVACWFGGSMWARRTVEDLREKKETLGLILGAYKQENLKLEREILDLKTKRPEPPVE